MNLRQLEIFCTVMRCRTTTAASFDLGLSQPAVSNAIKHLESTLGFSLFDRVGNRLVPTAEGLSVFQDAQPLEKMAAGLRQRARDLRDTKRGHLRVLSTRPVGDTYVPEAISNFIRSRERVQVYFDVQHMDSVIESVESGFADLGVALAPAPRPGLEIHVAADGRMMCALRPGHPLAERAIITPADLQEYNLIGLDPTSRLGASVAGAFHEAGVPLSPTISVLQGDAACSLVARGLGIAIVDEFSASKWQQSGALVTRPFSPAIVIPVAIISLKDRPLTRLAKNFVSSLLDVFTGSNGGREKAWQAPTPLVSHRAATVRETVGSPPLAPIAYDLRERGGPPVRR
jgi:DNA-binding transcriptional LysR family regulator